MTIFRGTAGADNFAGSEAADRFLLAAGDDFADGRRGADVLFGGDGDDGLFGFDGRDRLFGGYGADLLVGDNQNDRLHGGRGQDLMFGGDSDDRLFGGAGNDQLLGDRDADTLYGGAGDDSLDGGSGPGDALTDGNDIVFGGRGRDVLFGGAGFDLLYGGRGQDLFASLAGVVFDTETARVRPFGFERDVAVDFVRGEDQLRLVAFDGLGAGALNLPFAAMDSNGNHVLDDGDARIEVREASIPGDTRLSTVIDVEGLVGLSLAGTNTLTVFGVTGLTATDFV